MIRVGQSYKWHHTPEKTFLIVDIYPFDGTEMIKWEVTESDMIDEVGTIIRLYGMEVLIDALSNGKASLVGDKNTLVYRKIDKFKFI